MSTELTNLLPHARQLTEKREYLVRLATLSCIVATFVVVVHGALLVPSYLYLSEQVGLERARIAELDAALALSGEGELSTRVSTLKADAARLSAVSTSPAATTVLRAVLALPSNGITLSAFTFHAPPEGRISVTGTAATRESLRQYAAALETLTFAESTDLPLSAYARESDIPFTITLTGSLTP